MSEIEQLLQNISALTPYSVALVAFGGLVVGIAPSSFPRLSVAAGLAAGQGASQPARRRIEAFRLAAGFALGIATVDAVLGALFGLMGLANLRILVGFLGVAYLILAILLTFIGLALLRIIHIVSIGP